MECLQGDTLDTFRIYISDFGDLEGCTMQLILEDRQLRGVAKLTKNCTAIDGGFEVRLTSVNTSSLHGTYDIHFRMKDSDGLSYRKLAGVLIVRQAVQGS